MMNNKKKSLIIVATILLLTIGVFMIKNYLIYTNKGFYYGTPIDYLLILPALPFAPLVWLFENPGINTVILVFSTTIIFWLAVGYGIGYWMDKKNKK